MTSSFTDLSDSKSHPINLLEKIIISKNWVFERPIEDEIYIEVPTKYSNLIVIRSFSKAFGLPGIRVGYSMACKKLKEEIAAKEYLSSGVVFSLD